MLTTNRLPVVLLLLRRVVITIPRAGYRSRRAMMAKPSNPLNGYKRHAAAGGDYDLDITHAIKTTTARYFRFVYDKKELEPGSEDLDPAKWKPVLKVTGYLFVRRTDDPSI